MSLGAAKMITLARQTQEWLRRRPRLLDMLFAILMALIALADLASGDVSTAAREADTAGVLLVLAGATALVWRRSWPIAVFVSSVSVSCVFYVRDYGSFMAAIGLAGIYSVAAHENNRQSAWIALFVGFGFMFGFASISVLDGVDGYQASSAVSMTLLVVASIVAGVIIRNREEIFADTKERANRAEADQQAEAERAVTRERLRIAREMHDVVAHGMSLITVQAAAAQEIALTRPDDAARLMHSVESTGRDSLAEMRRMLGVLRNDDPADAAAGPHDRAPQPTLDDLDTTITHCIEAGTPTSLVIDGHQRPLPPGIELAAFRIVQEALTNVVKHAGAAATATVELKYDPDELHISISDTGRGAASELTGIGGGHGLIGMRERVEIYDGQLAAGPRPGGGYHVEASLPISRASEQQAAVAPEPEGTFSS